MRNKTILSKPLLFTWPTISDEELHPARSTFTSQKIPDHSRMIDTMLTCLLMVTVGKGLGYNILPIYRIGFC